MQRFNEFVDKKHRDAEKHLKIIKDILEHGGFKIEDYTNDSSDPYVYVYAPSKDLSFDGVRVYEIANGLAYRVQKESKTHPYGRAYELPVQEIYEDLLDDEPNDKIGPKIMNILTKEIKTFFEKSMQAEKESPMMANDPLDKAYMRSQGTDYSSKIFDNK